MDARQMTMRSIRRLLAVLAILAACVDGDPAALLDLAMRLWPV